MNVALRIHDVVCVQGVEIFFQRLDEGIGFFVAFGALEGTCNAPRVIRTTPPPEPK